MQVNPESVIVKMKLRSKVSKDVYFQAKLNKIYQYYLNSDHQTLIPYRRSLTFIDRDEMAEIDMTKLYSYPNFKHVLHVQSLNTHKPSGKPKSYEMEVEILRVQIQQAVNRVLKIKFSSAKITHKTEFIAKMKTYLVIMVNGVTISQSEVDQKGGTEPVFNHIQTINFNTLEDQIKLQIWDRDAFSKDDLVGEFNSLVFEFLTQVGEENNQELFYEGHYAGFIKYTLLEGPEVKL